MTRKKVVAPAITLAVVLFALFFRLHFMATTQWDHPIRADAAQYYSIGWNIVHHGVFSMTHPNDSTPNPDSYRGPGYPLLIALTMLLGGDEYWLRYLLVIQAALGALSVALTMAIAKKWLSFPYAIAAGLLVAVWPHMVTLSGLVLTETFFGFSLLLGIYMLTLACKRQQGSLYAAAGLVFAYSALINPAILLFPILATLLLALSQKRYAVLFLICALSLPMAWTARGMTLDEGRSSSGRLMENVFAGLDPDFDYSWTPAAIASRERVMEGVQRYKQDPEVALQMIIERLVERPTYYLRWYLLSKPVRFWQWPIFGHGDIYVYEVIASPFERQSFYRVVVSLCYGLNPWLMATAFLSVPLILVTANRYRPQHKTVPLLLVALLFCYATGLHLLLVPDPRYATPYRPFEILLALSFIAFVHRQWYSSRQKRVQQAV